MSEALLACAAALDITTKQMAEGSTRILDWGRDRARDPRSNARNEAILVLTNLQQINTAFQALVHAMDLLAQEYLEHLKAHEQDT